MDYIPSRTQVASLKMLAHYVDVVAPPGEVLHVLRYISWLCRRLLPQDAILELWRDREHIEPDVSVEMEWRCVSWYPITFVVWMGEVVRQKETNRQTQKQKKTKQQKKKPIFFLYFFPAECSQCILTTIFSIVLPPIWLYW